MNYGTYVRVLIPRYSGSDDTDSVFNELAILATFDKGLAWRAVKRGVRVVP